MDINDDDAKISPELLKKLQEFNSMNIEDIIDPIHDNDFETPEQEESPKKLIECPHEILFTVIGHAMQQNNKGELINTTELCKKHFHIPVPIDQDYKLYMNTFFEYLENNIIKTIDDTNKKVTK